MAASFGLTGIVNKAKADVLDGARRKRGCQTSVVGFYWKIRTNVVSKECEGATRLRIDGFRSVNLLLQRLDKNRVLVDVRMCYLSGNGLEGRRGRNIGVDGW